MEEVHDTFPKRRGEGHTGRRQRGIGRKSRWERGPGWVSHDLLTPRERTWETISWGVGIMLGVTRLSVRFSFIDHGLPVRLSLILWLVDGPSLPSLPTLVGSLNMLMQSSEGVVFPQANGTGSARRPGDRVIHIRVALGDMDLQRRGIFCGRTAHVASEVKRRRVDARGTGTRGGQGGSTNVLKSSSPTLETVAVLLFPNLPRFGNVNELSEKSGGFSGEPDPFSRVPSP